MHTYPFHVLAFYTIVWGYGPHSTSFVDWMVGAFAHLVVISVDIDSYRLSCDPENHGEEILSAMDIMGYVHLIFFHCFDTVGIVFFMKI